MPIIAYQCSCGLVTKKFYRVVKEIPSCLTCKCGKDTKRTLSAPSSASIVSIDNGVQARAVEVNLDIVEDVRNRSTKDFKEDK
jgi:hypothetical protein